MSETLPPDPNLSASVSTRTRGKKGKGKAPTVPEAEVDRLSIDPFQPSSSLRRSVLPTNPNHSDASDDASPEPVNLEPNQPDSGYQNDSTTPTPSTHTARPRKYLATPSRLNPISAWRTIITITTIIMALRPRYPAWTQALGLRSYKLLPLPYRVPNHQ